MRLKLKIEYYRSLILKNIKGMATEIAFCCVTRHNSQGVDTTPTALALYFIL